MGGRVSKGDIFNLAGLSDDHLLSPTLLYNYGHQGTLLPSFIPTTCGTAPLQLCNTVGLGKTALISGQMLIDKRYFCFINVIKCFVKCNVSIKCNVRVKQLLYSQKYRSKKFEMTKIVLSFYYYALYVTCSVLLRFHLFFNTFCEQILYILLTSAPLLGCATLYSIEDFK